MIPRLTRPQEARLAAAIDAVNLEEAVADRARVARLFFARGYPTMCVAPATWLALVRAYETARAAKENAHALDLPTG